MRATRPTNTIGRFGMPVFVLVLIGVNYINIYVYTPPTIALNAIFAESSYVFFAAIAWWLDRNRAPAVA